MKTRYPLRFIVPLLIFVTGSLIVASAWIVESRAQERAVIAVAKQQMRSIASFTAAELEGAIRVQQPEDARAALERTRALRNVRSIRVLDPDENVIYEFPERRSSNFFDDFKMLKPDSRVSITERDAILAGRFPILMWSDGQNLMPTGSGALYISFDYSDDVAVHNHALALRMTTRAIALIGVALGFWWLLRSLLLVRIDRLIKATRRVAEGDFGANYDIGGRDEISELGRELDKMTRNLRNQSDHLDYLDEHDALTGLKNRRGIESSIEQALRETRTRGAQFTLMMIDIDALRVINDTQGHLAGDELLRAFARLLEDELSSAISIARVGGDEFAVLIDADHGEPLEAIGERLKERLHEFRFERRGERFRIQATTGVIGLSIDLESAEQALSAADSACYSAKDSHRGGVQVVTSAATQETVPESSMRWVSQIQQALDEDRFELYAQKIEPLQEVSNDGIFFEILMRMIGRDGEQIPPSRFLPAAERYDLIGQIDRWVVRNTLQWLAENIDGVCRISHCSVNLSGASLGDRRLLDSIETQLSEHPEIDPGILCFEVTETAAVRNLERAQAFIRRMRRLGCRFALDDFGTGLSSFEYIKRLPIEYIKIDGIFVRDIIDDPIDRTVVKSIHEIARTLGIQTIAEFVENREIFEELKRAGIDFGQGYGIARPQPLRTLLDPSEPPMDQSANGSARQ